MRRASLLLLAPFTLALSMWVGCADTDGITGDDDDDDDTTQADAAADARAPRRDGGGTDAAPGSNDSGKDAAADSGSAADADAGAVVLTDIRDVQQGLVAVGQQARVSGVVTAVDPDSNFFFVQDPVGVPAYSGIAVYLGTSSPFAKPPVGVVVTLEGTVREFQRADSPLSRTNFEDVTLLEIGAETELPAPADIAPSANLTAEATAEPYEGVLVRIGASTVTTAPDPFASFRVTGNVLIANRLFDYEVPSVGQSYASLTGVLDYDRASYDIYPRSADDMPAAVAPINLVSLTPAASSVLVGSTQTYTVTLSRPADADLALALTTGDAATATVPATVTVLAGQSSAQFAATAIAASAQPVTIGVTLGTSTPTQLSAQLTVTAAPPVGTLLSVGPATLDVLGAVAGRTEAERTGLVQVELQAPAPVGGTLILLESAEPTAVAVPAEILIPEGQTRGSFRVRADSAVATSVVVSATDGDNLLDMTVQVVLAAPAPSLVTKELVLNEISYSPPTTIGDADCNGQRNTIGDEFVEIVNVSAHPVDLLNVSVHDATTSGMAPRYKFVSRVLGPGEAVVVFGKPDNANVAVAPAPVWCTAPIASTATTIGDAARFQAATSLELGNGGDTVVLSLTTKANELDKWVYASGAAPNHSLERSPQLGATTTFVRHDLLAGAAADRPITPGTLASGLPFALATP